MAKGSAPAGPDAPPGPLSSETVPPAGTLPQTAPSLRIDAVLIAIGKAASWLWLVTVGLIAWAVVSRYLFGTSTIALDELQWHLVGSAWLLGLSYTLALDEHVRVDVIHERLRPRARCWIEFAGILLLLLPFLAVAAHETIPFALEAYRSGERSTAPAGLGHRWIAKSVMALSVLLLLVAALSRLMRVTAVLFGLPRPLSLETRTDR